MTQRAIAGNEEVRHLVFPQLQAARVVVEDRTHPAMAHFAADFVHEDEWYSFERSARQPGVRALASLDESSYTPREIFRDIAMGDQPVVWSHPPGRGRVCSKVRSPGPRGWQAIARSPVRGAAMRCLGRPAVVKSCSGRRQ